MRGPRLQEQSTPGHLIAIFIILTIIIAITGYFYYENQKNIIRKEKYHSNRRIRMLLGKTRGDKWQFLPQLKQGVSLPRYYEKQKKWSVNDYLKRKAIHI